MKSIVHARGRFLLIMRGRAFHYSFPSAAKAQSFCVLSSLTRHAECLVSSPYRPDLPEQSIFVFSHSRPHSHTFSSRKCDGWECLLGLRIISVTIDTNSVLW